MTDSLTLVYSLSTSTKLDFSAVGNGLTPYRNRKLQDVRKVLAQTDNTDGQDLTLLVDRIAEIVAETKDCHTQQL